MNINKFNALLIYVHFINYLYRINIVPSSGAGSCSDSGRIQNKQTKQAKIPNRNSMKKIFFSIDFINRATAGGPKATPINRIEL